MLHDGISNECNVLMVMRVSCDFDPAFVKLKSEKRKAKHTVRTLRPMVVSPRSFREITVHVKKKGSIKIAGAERVCK